MKCVKLFLSSVMMVTFTQHLVAAEAAAAKPARSRAEVAMLLGLLWGKKNQDALTLAHAAAVANNEFAEAVLLEELGADMQHVFSNGKTQLQILKEKFQTPVQATYGRALIHDKAVLLENAIRFLEKSPDQRVQEHAVTMDQFIQADASAPERTEECSPLPRGAGEDAKNARAAAGAGAGAGAGSADSERA